METNKPFLKDLLKVFLVPTLINKLFMLYFGLNYTEHPGEGYGYGLVASIGFLLFTVGKFLWIKSIVLSVEPLSTTICSYEILLQAS
jgi:hypothetical protein